MADVTTFGQQFVTTYYQTFDSNRAGLAALYVSLPANARYTLENMQLHDTAASICVSSRLG